MKTQNIAAVSSQNRISPIQWLLSVLGIATAIICIIVLLRDLQPAHHESKESVSVNMPKVSLNQNFENLARTTVQSLRISF